MSCLVPLRIIAAAAETSAPSWPTVGYLPHRMKTKWKTRLFGDNSLNFYGWLAAGFAVIMPSAWFAVRAVAGGRNLSPQNAMFLAIWLMLVGLFGLAWHNYLARVAEKLDAAAPDPAEGTDGADGATD